MPPPLITTKWFSGKQRPTEFGPVTITFEEIAHSKYGKFVRPASVSGIVAVGSTSGRPSAPEPIAGLRVSQATKVPAAFRYNADTGRNAYNTGIPDAEKGHMMALELGGPDISANIVPQWAKWQGSGEWRRMEVRIKEMAEDGYSSTTDPHYLQFHCMVGYLSMRHPQLAALKRLAFPSHFKVVVTKLNKQTKAPYGTPEVMYDKSPQRNNTDDMMALRTMLAVDRESLGRHFEPYPDWVEDIQVQKGKKRDRSYFKDDEQDALHVGIPPVAYRNTSTTQTAYDTGVGAQFETNKRMKIAQPMDVEP